MTGQGHGTRGHGRELGCGHRNRDTLVWSSAWRGCTPSCSIEQALARRASRPAAEGAGARQRGLHWAQGCWISLAPAEQCWARPNVLALPLRARRQSQTGRRRPNGQASSFPRPSGPHICIYTARPDWRRAAESAGFGHSDEVDAARQHTRSLALASLGCGPDDRFPARPQRRPWRATPRALNERRARSSNSRCSAKAHRRRPAWRRREPLQKAAARVCDGPKLPRPQVADLVSSPCAPCRWSRRSVSELGPGSRLSARLIAHRRAWRNRDECGDAVCNVHREPEGGVSELRAAAKHARGQRAGSSARASVK